MEAHRSFALQKFKLDIEKCDSKKELQKIAVDLMQLYMRQQDTVKDLVRKGWLPDEAINQGRS
ncbi:MAG: hypothetical protein ACO3N3_13395 [bacterium]